MMHLKLFETLEGLWGDGYNIIGRFLILDWKYWKYARHAQKYWNNLTIMQHISWTKWMGYEQ